MTANISEISQSIKESLIKCGAWKKYKALLRKDIFTHLESEGLPENLSSGNEKINEMNNFIIQYLKQQGLNSTLLVFKSEIGK